MQDQILILTNSHDLHADIVEHKLRDLTARPFRINQDEFPRDYALELTYGAQGMSGLIRHLPTGQQLATSDIGAVWARKPAPYAFRSADLSAQELVFARTETDHVLFSLLHALDCFWMNHPKAVRGALWKGEQLTRAARMGFVVPPTLIANDPDAVRAFYRANKGKVVIKTLSSASLSAEEVSAEQRQQGSLMTTLMTAEHLDAIESVRELPCLFQGYVDKAYELRVTVIGEQVFATRIESQQDPRTAIDYRDFSVEIPYLEATLSDAARQLCRDFVHSYGLAYGAIDLIVTPDHELVFLENNPGGQFLFVEQLVPSLKMTDAVASLLLAESGRRGGRA